MIPCFHIFWFYFIYIYFSLFIRVQDEFISWKKEVNKSCDTHTPWSQERDYFISLPTLFNLLEYSSVCKVTDGEYKCISTSPAKKKKTGTSETPIIRGGHCLMKCVKDRYMRDTYYQWWTLPTEMCKIQVF